MYRARDRKAGIAAPPGAFRTPGYPWTPALFVVAAVFVVASSVAANPRNALIGTLLLALGRAGLLVLEELHTARGVKG